MAQLEKINAKIEKLIVSLSEMEESLATTDECLVDIYKLEERLGDRLDRLEETNVDMKNNINAIFKEITAINKVIIKYDMKNDDLIEQTLEDRVILMEEEIAGLKQEKNEMMDDLNDAIRSGVLMEKEIEGLKQEKKEMKDDLDETIRDAIVMKEEITVLKVENIDLRCHLNGAIRELNTIATVLNREHGDLVDKTIELDE